MRYKYLLLLLLILQQAGLLNGQAKTYDVSQYLDSVYIYKVKDKESVEYYYHSYLEKSNILTAENYVCSYSSRDVMPSLPPGSYYIVTIDKDSKKLSCTFYRPAELNYIMLRTDKYPEIFFYDDLGIPYKNIRVLKDDQSIALSSHNQTYSIAKMPHKSPLFLKVENNGVIHSYRIRRWDNHKARKESYHQLYRFRKESARNQPALNECKVGDTIRIQDTITEVSLAYLRLRHYYNRDSLITPLRSDENGVFSYNFIVPKMLEKYKYSFSIDLTEDKKATTYSPTLKKHYYYCAPVIYSLKAALDTTRHFINKPPVLSLLVKERDNEKIDSHFIVIEAEVKHVYGAVGNNVFVPNKLFKDTIAIELNKDMRIPLPTYKFPSADFSYSLSVRLISDDSYQQKSEVFNLQNIASKEIVDMDIRKDKLLIEIKNDTESIYSNAILYSYIKNRLTEQKNIQLPYIQKINPAITKYRVIANDIENELVVSSVAIPCLIDYSIFFSKDSAHISLSSPYSIPFWYTIWKNNKIQHIAYTPDKASLSLKGKEHDKYTLRLEHLWGGDLVDLHTPLTLEPDTLHSKIMRRVDRFYDYLSVYEVKPEDYSTPITADFISQRMPLINTEELDSKKASIPKVDLLANIANSSPYISTNATLHLSYKNTEAYFPHFVVLIENNADNNIPLLQRTTIYNADTPYIPLAGGKSYTLYVLPDSVNIHRETIDVKRDGRLFFTVDMGQTIPHDSNIDSLLSELSKTKHVKLIITDEYGEPMAFATVSLSNTKAAIMSNLDGVAILELPENFYGDIEISFIGMKTQKIRYRGQSIINVTMEDDNILLE